MQSTEPTKTDIGHGTYRAYNKLKCRCGECQAANREHVAASRLRKHGDRSRTSVNRYRTAHTRVRSLRGKASAHICEQCGIRAVDWALMNESPRTITQQIDGVQRRWSEYVEDYRPLCRACHRSLDSIWNTPKP